MTSKIATGAALLFGLLGLYVGLRSWSSPSHIMQGYAIAALLMGGGLILMIMTVLRLRARPEAPDALRALRSLVLLGVSGLVGVLPRMLWPSAESLQVGGTTVSLVLTTIAIIMMAWQSRQLWAHRR